MVFNGVTYTASTSTKDTVRTAEGCDSIYNNVNIIIRIITPVSANNTVYGCNSIVFNGVTYTANATILDTLRTIEGCDSVFRNNTIIIKYITPISTNQSLSGCGSVVFNGITYTASTVVLDTVRTFEGCDSIYRTNYITVKNITPTSGTLTQFGCNSVVFNGITYTSSTIIADTVRTVEGCDSIYNTVNIVVKIITPVSANNTVYGCNSIVFNGVTYTANATVLDTLRTPQGCDSVFRTNSIIIKYITPVSATQNLLGCNSLTFNGVTYTVSTTVLDTLRTAEGCDSVFRTNIIDIRYITAVTNNAFLTGCGSVVFNGITYTASTVVRDTLRTTYGCDSVYNVTTIAVRIIVPQPQTLNLKGCNSLVFNGVTYTASTVVLDTLKTVVEGCDSLYRTINIAIQTINPVVQNNSLDGCRNVFFNGKNYTTSTLVKDTLRTLFGCDSVYRNTNITVFQFDLILASSQNPVMAGNTVSLQSSSTTPYTVTAWTPGVLFPLQTVKTQSLLALESSVISVYGLSQDGCKDTATLSLVVNKENNLFFPNTFTPNGDGQNDVFKVYGNNIKALDMRIFNQWGQLIFQTNDLSAGWNGFSKGKLQPVGVYVFTVRLTLNDNSVVNKSGSINLIK